MRCIFSPTALLLFAALQTSSASPLADSNNGQRLLVPKPQRAPGDPQPPPKRKLFGRFLHVTDIHPDVLYLRNSSVSKLNDCHSGNGVSGYWGAPRSECDSPLTLANATFEWIRNNLKDQIDFVIWTGDNVRHDNDVRFPRNETQIFEFNRMMVGMMYDVFKKPDSDNDRNPNNDLIIPVVPTLGNNDIMPHNIMLAGPSHITHTYLDIWRNFIPEEQRHMFQHGAYFWVEVIPHKLAVFSINTIFFFSSNAAVDGCNFPSEPGYQHFTWLKVQLDLMRERGMKAMMMGHVPPARTRNKQSWDDTCWAKFVIWMWHYRDIVVGNLFGHMNLDHFLLMDIDLAHKLAGNPKARSSSNISTWEETVHVQVAGPYLSEMREVFSQMPQPPPKSGGQTESGKGPHKDHQKYVKKIGGKYAERYVQAFVGPSVLPNYFPSLRVFEYNITGLVDDEGYLIETPPVKQAYGPHENPDFDLAGKKPPPPPDPNIPSPPPTGSAPGPAYSPQTLSFTGIVQYYANLTHLNGWVPTHDDGDDEEEGFLPPDGDGKERQKKAKQAPLPLEYKLEYTTSNDKGGLYENMEDMTVRSFVKLAAAMRDADVIADDDDSLCDDDDNLDDVDDGLESPGSVNGEGKKKKKKKGRKHKNHHKDSQQKRDALWHTFVKRAFVSSVPDDEIGHINDGGNIED
ncbi:Endopolyphosphatase [Orbilia brochopaga]|nr:Endopolyphosphatase [Drechslerella brochopaga]